MQDKEVKFILNDLLDIVERLTNMAEDMNPGATQDISFLRFLTERVKRSLSQIVPE